MLPLPNNGTFKSMCWTFVYRLNIIITMFSLQCYGKAFSCYFDMKHFVTNGLSKSKHHCQIIIVLFTQWYVCDVKGPFCVPIIFFYDIIKKVYTRQAYFCIFSPFWYCTYKFVIIYCVILLHRPLYIWIYFWCRYLVCTNLVIISPNIYICKKYFIHISIVYLRSFYNQ